MKITFLYLSIGLAAGLLFVNIYTSIVDAASWNSAFPESVLNARKYFTVVNPGTFFRIFSPLNQVVALACLVLFWKVPAVRTYLGVALLLFVATEALTFAFFYPRNGIIFTANMVENAQGIKKALNEWIFMNWVRSIILSCGVICSMMGLHTWYQIKN